MTDSFDFFTPISKVDWDKNKKQIAEFDKKELERTSGDETFSNQKLFQISRQIKQEEHSTIQMDSPRPLIK